MNTLLNLLFKTVPRQDRHILTLAVASSTLLVLIAVAAELIGFVSRCALGKNPLLLDRRCLPRRRPTQCPARVSRLHPACTDLPWSEHPFLPRGRDKAGGPNR